MPLVLVSLTDELRELFADPPLTSAECAQGWADAVKSYATSIVPPSTTVASAAASLASALQAAFDAPDAIPGMETAFAAFGVTVGGGMAGYTPIPPAGPVGFAGLFAAGKPATHDAAAQQIGSAIHIWMTTGVSTLVAPPYTVMTWS